MTEIEGDEGYPSGTDEAELMNFYLDGSCCYLALAMHDATGWPIHVMGHRTTRSGGEEGIDFSHATCLHPTGVLVDIAGPMSIPDAESFWLGEAIVMDRRRFVELCDIEFDPDLLDHARDVGVAFVHARYPELALPTAVVPIP